MTARALDLAALNLQRGNHSTAATGLCALEAAAYLAGEPHSDSPACVSPVIAAFLRRWNDDLADEARNRLLKPLLLRILDTRGTDAIEARRAWLADDWLIRAHTPAWLDLAGLGDAAASLRALPEIRDGAAFRQCADQIVAASDAAWAAASDAAWAAVRAAVGAAVGGDLTPTGAALQSSALALIDRMIAAGHEASS